MTADDVVQIGRDALFMVIKLAAPLLLVSLIIGLIVSIFQTVTSIQVERALTTDAPTPWRPPETL